MCNTSLAGVPLFLHFILIPGLEKIDIYVTRKFQEACPWLAKVCNTVGFLQCRK